MADFVAEVAFGGVVAFGWALAEGGSYLPHIAAAGLM